MRRIRGRERRCISWGTGAGSHACGPSPPAPLCLLSACAVYFWCAVLQRRGPAKHVSRDDVWHNVWKNTTIAQRYSDTNTAQREDDDSVSAQVESEGCCWPGSLLGLARIDASPPQRVEGRIGWTPACRSQNNLANHIAEGPGHLHSFTSSVHLQTADRNTYQPPIAISPCACCYTPLPIQPVPFCRVTATLGLHQIWIDTREFE